MSAHKPRSGSLAYYPRVRAKSQKAVFKTFASGASTVPSQTGHPHPTAGTVVPLNFVGYKAGMTHVFGKNSHEKSVSFGQETMIPSTVIECPPLRIIGARVYGKTHYGLKVLGEVSTDKPGKHLRGRVRAFKKKGKKRKEEKSYSGFDELLKLGEKAEMVVLLAEAQPALTGSGKKIADIAEIVLNGNADQQFEFAKGKLGKELRVSEVFSTQQFVDVKAVDKGKGFQGPVKRFGVKIHRPKAKKHRYVGSIGPWHPPTVMWTVPRPGQLGYQTRTEYNKRILIVDSKPEVNPARGFNNYGNVRNEYVILAGSVPGPAKRFVSIRHAVRVHNENLAKYTDIKLAESGAVNVQGAKAVTGAKA